MEWENLLKLDRLNDAHYPEKKHRPPYVQDADRILFSTPFRRLANKTQVHPLYENDHLHHRLIHSFEVACVGRSLGYEIGTWLADECKYIPNEKIEIIPGLVQAACMAHDIGNPPFGHSGEEAIASWFREKFSSPQGIFQDISNPQRPEFESFEGNAQGFRLLTRTEMYKNDGGMRLTLGSLGAFTKYPVSAFIKQTIDEEKRGDKPCYIGLKKYGVFENDIKTFQEVATKLGLPETPVKDLNEKKIGSWWRRHPLAFLMEAADDICYNIMDLEDAYLAGNISFEEVKNLLQGLITAPNKAYPDTTPVEIISRYRALAITGGIKACVQAFKDNYDSIMNGTYQSALVDSSNKSEEFGKIKHIAAEKIFNAARKTELEVYGRNVVYKTLDGILPLLNELRDKNWNIDNISSYHSQLVRALNFPLSSINNSYDALHCLTDFVSGMTDRYAVKVANMISR